MNRTPFLEVLKAEVGKTPNFTELIDETVLIPRSPATLENLDAMYELASGKGKAFEVFTGKSILNRFKQLLLKTKRCSVETTEEDFV